MDKSIFYSNKQFMQEFIELYKSQSCLWQVSHKNYRKNAEREDAYEVLLNKLKEIEPHANKGNVISKIRNLRSAVLRTYKLSDSGKNNREIKLWYFDLLKFIVEKQQIRRRKPAKLDDEVDEEDKFIEAQSMIPFQDPFWIEFIDLYKSLRCLWSVQSEEFYNNTEKENAYNLLVNKLKEIDPNANKETVIKRIHNFKTIVKRERKKHENSRGFGPGGDKIFETKLWYYHLFNFLQDFDDQSTAKEPPSSLDDDDENSLEVSWMNHEDTSYLDENKPTPAKQPRTKSLNDGRIHIETPTSSCSSNASASDAINNYQYGETATQYLRRSDNDSLVKDWSIKLSRLTPDQKQFAEKIINDTLFEAALGTLTRNGVKFLKASESE